MATSIGRMSYILSANNKRCKIHFRSINIFYKHARYFLACTNTSRNYSSASQKLQDTAPCKPLDGIKVLDLTRILAGPVCTMILGDMGAEIIKVEKPGTGDDTRSWGPPFVGDESCYFLSVNRNKKSIAVDMKKPEGVNIIKKLVCKSDVLIENFLPGKLDKMGLGYADLKQIAPHLIYCSITGFGSDGPYKSRAGYDVIAASIGGLLSITGPEDGEPCKVGVAMTDISTGLYAHGAILAAILQRNTTGCGQKIDCNLLSTQVLKDYYQTIPTVACLVNLGTNYLNVGLEPVRRGTAHESIVPYQAFRTADGYITIGAGNDNQFETLCKVINRLDLLSNDLYRTNEQRVKNRKNLLFTLSKTFSEKSTAEWLELFEGCGIPYGPINNLPEVFKDPQVIHNNMIQEIEHSSGKIKLAGPPVKFDNKINKAFLPPPLLGQHTNEILSKILNYSNDEIENLKDLKIIQ